MADQLGTVLNGGTYLATRYEDQDTINLYSLGSFYVEVYYDPEVNHLHRCHSFTSTQHLALYIDAIQVKGLS